MLCRELTVVIIAAVYVPPDANVSLAFSQLYTVINKQCRSVLREFVLSLGTSSRLVLSLYRSICCLISGGDETVQQGG